jgi:hypothetical protein
MRAVRRRESKPAIEALELREGHRLHGARAVGRTIEARVVQHDDVAVGSRVDVELETIGAGGEAGGEGR